MDGASWHTDDIAKDIDNLSIIKLPPYSPELNPVEQVWSWLRQYYLANQSFKDYEDIISKAMRWLESIFNIYKKSIKNVL
ncbi:hypothetical protein GAGA_0888 [Paraglaciecola agarilytica NO2]|uniref:Tc1-like transposase DDE domain-containing protein n=1 Tax=Paraglaciecola agarilytica NO2 TaxID=1125747 RepID=A0ABQ0I338_9ALTE|nr:hypothetical protein GAGA_0888 [Paraglaciecola agarilytica NO2]